MANQDADFFALLLEELEKSQAPQTCEWLENALAGPSLAHVRSRLKEQLPSSMPWWVRGLIAWMMRFRYNRQHRIIRKKVRGLLQSSCDQGYLQQIPGQTPPHYTITEAGKHWLEQEYAPARGQIDDSDLQATYDAVKLCKTLAQTNSLQRDELMKHAFPPSPIPPQAGRMLRAMLQAHNESIPSAFERAIQIAQQHEWIEQIDRQFSLTTLGKEQGCHFLERLAPDHGSEPKGASHA